MRIACCRDWVGIVAAVVELAGNIVVVVQIVVGVLDAIVDHTDAHTSACVVVPNAGYVDVDSGLPAALAVIQQVPLIAK